MPIFEKSDPLALKAVISINIATIVVLTTLGFIVRGALITVWPLALINWYLLTKPLIEKKVWGFWANIVVSIIGITQAIYQIIIQQSVVEVLNLLLPIVIIVLLLNPEVRAIFIKPTK